MKKLFILFLVISANLSLAQDAVLLRVKYEEGATYNVAMKMSQEMGAMMSMGMTIDMDLKVTSVQEETYDSEMKFTKMTMDMLQAGNAISYDSSKSDDELDEGGKMMKTQMGPMLEAVIYAKGNHLGEIIEAKVEPNVIGMEDIAQQSSNIVYPTEAVKVGSTWTNSKDEKGMIMEYIYTVKSISEDKIVLDLTGEVSGMAVGKITGTMDIERSSGIPVNSLIDMNLSVSGQDMKSTVTMVMTKA
jgi:FKBP-type peptidyl-prolyl cis-trans isomerase 2